MPSFTPAHRLTATIGAFAIVASLALAAPVYADDIETPEPTPVVVVPESEAPDVVVVPESETPDVVVEEGEGATDSTEAESTETQTETDSTEQGAPAARLAAPLAAAAVVEPLTCPAATTITSVASLNLSSTSTDGSATTVLEPAGLHITTAATGHRKAAGYVTGTGWQPLDSVTDFVLTWNGSANKPGGQLPVDLNGDNVQDGILVIESIYGGIQWLSVPAGGTWVSLPDAPHVAGYGGYPNQGTLAQWAAAYPNAQWTSPGYSLGSGLTGDGVIGSITVVGSSTCVITFAAPAPPTAKPVILTPANGSATNTSTLTATWTTVPLATAYETRVANNEAMTDGLVGPFGPFGTTSLTTPVAEGTYWFQVRGVNADGAGPWSLASQFTTDTTGPHVTVEKQTYQAAQGGRIAVTLTFNEPIIGSTLGQGWNGSGTTWTKIYYTSKSYTVNFTDRVGNAGTFTFTVDATKPTVTNIVQVFQTNQGGRISVTLTFSESIDPASLPQGWYGSGTTFTKAFYSTKEVTVPFTDLVGNPGTYTFTVDMTAPTVPTNLSPGGWVISSDTFSWNASTDANGPITYEIAVGNHPNLVGGPGTAMSSGFHLVGTTTDTSLPYVLPIGATFWQVRATDSIGNVSAWTAPQGVQVIGVPVLSSTQSGVITGDLTVSWTAVNGIGGNSGYEVEYTLSDGTTVVHTVTGLTDTQLADATNQGAVSVRVRAIYNIGFTAGVPESKNGVWSNTLSFTRDSIGPVAPQPFNPENGRVQSNATPTLVWLPVADAAGYEVRTSTSPGRDADNELNGDGIQTYSTTSAQQLLPALGEGWIWWQVRGTDALGNVGPWSSIWSTGVDTVAPDAVILDLPANNAVMDNNTFDVTWFAVTDAVKYVVESSTVEPTQPGSFATVNGGGTREVTGTSFNAGGSPDATYYYHVRAVDAAGNLGPWSETRVVTIDTVAPGDVTLVSPANPTSTTSTSLDFTWEDLAELPSYVFEVSSSNALGADGEFSGFPEVASWLTDEAGGTLSNLSVGTYYWHVAAVDAAGNLGNWSAIWSFTVTAPVVPPVTDPPVTTPPVNTPPVNTPGAAAPAPLTFVTQAGTPVAPVAAQAAPTTTATDSTTEELPTQATTDDQLPTEAFDGETTAGDAAWWPWAIGAAILLLLALLFLILLRRRRPGAAN